MAKITEKAHQLLEKREFVSIATVDRDGNPNSVPKFFFRAKGDFIYLIDYVVGKTVENLKENPRCSVSFMDLDSLEAYRLNGTAALIEKGRLFNAFLKEWDRKLMELSVNRVVEAVRTGKKRGTYELDMARKFIVLKIKVETVIKVGRRGDIWEETG
ncbi:MAG: pyridoxamine 5'-phosphate oxidase family protein [Candidatus Omnitrophota bacterium]